MNKAKLFIIWLDGVLDGRETLDETQTLMVKKKLDGIFDHQAMDAITKPTLAELGEQHGFEVKTYPNFGEGQDGETYRC